MWPLLPPQDAFLSAPQARVSEQRVPRVLAVPQGVQAKGELEDTHDRVPRESEAGRVDAMIVTGQWSVSTRC